MLDDIEDSEELTAQVEKELLELRGAHGILTIQKFQRMTALRRVCGGNDLLDAFMMFEREMRRYIKEGSREENAAAISITAKAETVLDRLEHVVGALPQDGRIRDQRTGRRWSDDGIRTISRDMVHLAEVQGRLGQELVTIEVSGSVDDGLRADIYQMTSKALDDTAPLVRIWRYANGDPEDATSEVDFDFSTTPVNPVADEKYQMRHYVLKIELPADILTANVDPGDPVYSFSIEGRDAPMRTVTFASKFVCPKIQISFTNDRTISSVEMISILSTPRCLLLTVR